MKTKDVFPDESEIAAEKSAEDKRKISEFKTKDEWKFLMSDERGQRFIYRLLKECGVWESSFKTSSEIYFLEGRRSVGLKIQNELDAMGLDYFIKILKVKKEIENVN